MKILRRYIIPDMKIIDIQGEEMLTANSPSDANVNNQESGSGEDDDYNTLFP